MYPKKIHWLLIAIASGALVLILSLGWIDQSAARGSIGQPIKPSALSIAPANLLINPDFENGTHDYSPDHQNIQVPNGWMMRWYTNAYIFNGENFNFRQPEVKLDDKTQWPFCDGCAPNVPPRIHTGRYAVDAFASFGGMDMVLYQQVGNIPIGSVVTGSAWLHAWTSGCNPFPPNHDPQPAVSLLDINQDDGTCGGPIWPIDTNHMLVGIDPYGGTNPRAISVTWNWNVVNPLWWGPYDFYSSTLPVTVTAKAFTTTLFLRGITVAPIKFDDMYFDTASLSYCYRPNLLLQPDQLWPLNSPTITLQSTVSLTQLALGLTAPNGASVPLSFLGTTGSPPAVTSRWRFEPKIAGSYLVTLTADQLQCPFSQALDVKILPYSYVQDQLPPPANVTFTLYSPINLTNITKVLTDPLGSPVAFNFVGSNYVSPTYAFQWMFAPVMTGSYTLDLFADQFVQHWQIPIVAASSRSFLPIVLQNFTGP
jgi:hypothetical protein